MQIKPKKAQTMTSIMLYNACKKNDYLILRLTDNSRMAVNCKCVEIAKRRNRFLGTLKTVFVSFRPCTFQEYITHKTPFC